MCAKLPSPLDALGRKINRYNTASAGAGDLDGQNSHQPSSYYAYRFAYTQISLANTLQRDGSNRSQGSRQRGYLRRNMHCEIARNKVHLGMVGIPSATAGDTITWTELVHTIPDGN